MLKKLIHKIWRKMVFFGGDIRRIQSFPWLTWDVSEHLITYEEAMEGLKHIRPGDVGIHRDNGFLSNLAIPGFMKHAWIHIIGPKYEVPTMGEYTDISRNLIVEATSDGVLRRSAMYPIRSDYAIILRPIHANDEEKNRAVEKAKKIIGCQYDADFKFDIEDELKIYDKNNKNVVELKKTVDNINSKWDGGFSCTEVVSFCYWHIREKIGIQRHTVHGKEVITADDFINENMEIVWMSKSVTPEIAREMGLSEIKISMINKYRSLKHD